MTQKTAQTDDAAFIPAYKIPSEVTEDRFRQWFNSSKYSVVGCPPDMAQIARDGWKAAHQFLYAKNPDATTDTLTAQRDEMLEALRLVHDDLREHDDDDINSTCLECCARARVKVIISKADSQKVGD